MSRSLGRERLVLFFEKLVSGGLQGEEMYGKVLTLSGTQDAEGTPILLTSYSVDRVVRLWQLPDFADRGHLNAITNSVAVASWQAFLFAGDYSTGNVKVWKWRTPGMAG